MTSYATQSQNFLWITFSVRIRKNTGPGLRAPGSRVHGNGRNPRELESLTGVCPAGAGRQLRGLCQCDTLPQLGS